VTRTRLLSPYLCLAIAVAIAPATARAQTTTASVRGTVTDDQRLPVPSATVTIEDTERGISRSVTSDVHGLYEIAGLQPGDYHLRAALTGFSTTEIDVRLEVNQRLQADVVLKAGTVAENVVVRQAAPLLDTTSASVGQVIGQDQVSQLPLNGRQFLDLALLVPGAHTSHGAGTGSTVPLYWRPGQNSAISVTGGRPSANAFRIDWPSELRRPS
jgi:hypothetical protein